jgi:hypothetical protein
MCGRLAGSLSGSAELFHRTTRSRCGLVFRGRIVHREGRTEMKVERRSVRTVYAALSQLIDGTEAVVAVPRLAKAASLSDRSVQYGLRSLEASGHITVRRRDGRPNIIRINPECRRESLAELVARAFRPLEDTTQLLEIAWGDEELLRCALQPLADRPAKGRIPKSAGVRYFASEVRERVRRLRFSGWGGGSGGCICGRGGGGG